MKIVHFITRLIIGGAQENTLLSCEGQHDLGHDVTLITGPGLGPEGSLIDRARGYGYRVIEMPSLHRSIKLADFGVYRELVNTLCELRPDVVHTHSSKAGIIGRRAGRKAGVPKVIHTIHGLAFTASKRRSINCAYRLAEKWAAPMTDKIVCVATDMATQSLAAGIGKPQQYVTVYSGMDTRPFLSPPVPREDIRRELGIEPQHIVVGTIARLFHLKGHDDLIALAPSLCANFPDLRFMWIGDGLLRQQFERQIAALGLPDRFIFTGLVPPAKIPQLAGAMDILVHPSRREGLARALPQGQLAGCPVVAYDIDGNREGLIAGETGYLVPPFDRVVLGQRLASLLSDLPRTRAMGEAGRAFAAGRFDTTVMVAALEQVYQSA